MPSLQIRDLPEPIYTKLQMLARRDHRSLAQQAVAVLEKGLGLEENPKKRRQRLIENLLSRSPDAAVENLPEPAGMVRSDRESR